MVTFPLMSHVSQFLTSVLHLGPADLRQVAPAHAKTAPPNAEQLWQGEWRDENWCRDCERVVFKDHCPVCGHTASPVMFFCTRDGRYLPLGS